MTTYYVDTAVGNDGNAGTSEGAGNAWATIDHAMNTVAAGDKVWVKASGNYNELATIDTVGTTAAYITFEGYTSTTGDDGKVTIDGQSTRANCIVASTTSYYAFKNFIFTGATASGFDGGTSADQIVFYNCEFTNNGSHGCRGDNQLNFVNCVFSNNTGKGADVDGTLFMVGCTVFGNADATNQITMSGGGLVLAYNVVYGGTAGQTAQIFTTSSTNGAWINNTVDCEGLSTIAMDGNSTFPNVIMNNIIYDGTTAFESTFTAPYQMFMGYNLINGMTNDYYNGTGQVYNPVLGLNDVTGAPAFTDEAGDDYTLAAGSPAIDAGILPGGVT